MNISKRILPVLTLLLFNAALMQAATLGNLRCEARVNPVGITVTTPRLSWILESDKRGARQTAYQILVASSPGQLAKDQGDVWDSGKVASPETFNIDYAGSPLVSEQRCLWKVRIWDGEGKPSAWSASASWSMGLLTSEEWQGQWIGWDAPRADAEAARPADAKEVKKDSLFLPPPVQVRTGFHVDKEIKRATLHAAALGLTEIYLNGRRVSDDYFTSGWTDYHKRVYARSYDVTGMVRTGDNALAAVIADGWFSGHVLNARDVYGKKPRVKAQLHLEYADGSSAVVATGPAWKAAVGALTEADFLMGETYNSQAETVKWCEPGFDDHTWAGVSVGSLINPMIEAHPGEPVRAIAEFKANSISEPKPSIYILDLGQNFAGVGRLTIKGAPGQKVTMRYGERLNPDGTLYTGNLRDARVTDTYTCRGGGESEIWQPRFTYHGFRFIEVSGLTQKPSTDTVVGVALSTDMAEVGSFTCSDPMLNQLRNAIYWTLRSNYMDVPTDCPQRSERLGWTADAMISMRAAIFNTDVQAFFTKWLVDIADAQTKSGQFPPAAPARVGIFNSPGWEDAGVICPWTIYEAYGDRRALELAYPGMVRFIDYCEKRFGPGLVPPADLQIMDDWLNVSADTPKDVFCLAYFAHSTQLMEKAAGALGKPEDAARFHALSGRIKEAFNREYVSDDGRIKGGELKAGAKAPTRAGDGVVEDSRLKGGLQTRYVMAIAFDLLDSAKQKLAGDHLVKAIEERDWHLSTGIHGTKELMNALTKTGRNDVAFRLLHNDTYPSWGFFLKSGGTTIWERWNGSLPEANPSMNSFNHCAFGAVYQWMVENIGGIRSDGPAYGKIIIAPQIDPKLTHAETRYDSIRGRIETRWRTHDGQLTLGVSIPPNTTATVLVPAAESSVVTEGGQPAGKASGVKFLRNEPGVAVFAVQSGNYEFHSTRLPAPDKR